MSIFISSGSFSYCLLRSVGLLAADTIRMRSPWELAKSRATLLGAGWKNVLSVRRVTGKRECVSLFRRDGSFSRMRRPYFLSGKFYPLFTSISKVT